VALESVTLNDNYELDLARGTMTNRRNNARVFIFGAEAWRNLKSELFSKFSSGAAVIFFGMGKSYGSSISKSLRIKTMTSLRGSKWAASAGWGLIRASGDLEGGTMVEVTIRDCVFCLDGSIEHGCNFMRGVIEGMADVAYNSLHRQK